MTGRRISGARELPLTELHDRAARAAAGFASLGVGRDDAVAVHAVCQEAVFWETLEKLKAAGASAILVLPIEKMM